jgi:hypothetical protein
LDVDQDFGTVGADSDHVTEIGEVRVAKLGTLLEEGVLE